MGEVLYSRGELNVGQEESEGDALLQGFISADKESVIHWNRS